MSRMSAAIIISHSSCGSLSASGTFVPRPSSGLSAARLCCGDGPIRTRRRGGSALRSRTKDHCPVRADLRDVHIGTTMSGAERRTEGGRTGEEGTRVGVKERFSPCPEGGRGSLTSLWDKDRKTLTLYAVMGELLSTRHLDVKVLLLSLSFTGGDGDFVLCVYITQRVK